MCFYQFEIFFVKGGLGEAVLSAVAEERDIAVKKLAVTDIPRSGPPAVLLDLFGISAKNIVAAVKKFAWFKNTTFLLIHWI